MLAAPRNKRSYTLLPKGKPLYEDEDRFGAKLMQKMGWSKEKGLGRDESGSKDFLRVRYKNDVKGLGFEHRDDQWTQHEQNFNGLLSTLNGNEEGEKNDTLNNVKQVSSDESENEAPRLGFGFQDTTACETKTKVKKDANLKDKISGISLEEKSKKSRARVHYQKFTRGKDLSQYSEKDLANIFGKKVGETTNSQQEQEATDDEAAVEESNVHFLHTGVSVEDYFKLKMQAKKQRLENGSKTNTGEASVCAVNNSASDEDQQEQDISKKKKKSKKDKVSENTENLKILEIENEVVEEVGEKTKKMGNENESNDIEIVDAEVEKPKKNKKKSKNKTQENLQPQEDQVDSKSVFEKETQSSDIEIIEAEVQKPKKSKKKSKNKTQEILQPQEEQVESKSDLEKEKQSSDIEIIEAEVQKPKKSKKKSKNKTQENLQPQETEKENPSNAIEIIEAEVQKPKKNKKKSKNKTQENLQPQEDQVDSKSAFGKETQSSDIEIIEAEVQKPKKSKKKSKSKYPENLQPEENLLEKTEEVVVKNNKRKRENLEIEDNEIENTKDADEPQKKKHKKLKNENDGKKTEGIIETEIIGVDQENLSEQTEKKPKNKKLTADNQEGSKVPTKKSNTEESKNVSCKANDDVVKKSPNIENLMLENTVKLYNSYNIYTISSFCAEKFRNINLNDFKGSILSQIEGYGLSEDLQLKVQIIKNDEERITNLWKGILDKYGNLGKPKNCYLNYVKEARHAHKKKSKPPKLHIKTWKRKNAFNVI